METLEDLFRRHHRYRPPSIVDGLRQPSIRGRLIPSASRAQPISHSLRAALHISQTCLQCRQSNANTALILELKLPSFANTELLPPRVLPILNHHPGARAFKLLQEMTHRGSCQGILQPYIHNVCLRERFNVVYGDGCVTTELRKASDVACKFIQIIKFQIIPFKSYLIKRKYRYLCLRARCFCLQ